MSTTGDFQVDFPSSLLSGTINAEVHEAGKPSSQIIDLKNAWVVDVHWVLTGSILSMINGTWHVDGYMDAMGPGPDFELPNEPAPFPLNPSNGNYSATFNIPAGTVVALPGETDIVYKLVVTVTYKDTLGIPGAIAGFVEMPMLHFYTGL